MNKEILNQVYQHSLFSLQDLEDLLGAHNSIKMKKGDFLLQKEEIADEYYIIEEGLVRMFLYDFNGNDITTGFVGIGELAVEVVSLFQRVPSKEFFQCLTDTVLWKIEYKSFQELFHKIPALREWGRDWMALELFKSKTRATEMITQPAVKRYLHLMEEKPQVIKQAPLKFIASYLGITDTSLSRIRKEITY
jgi:CRP-like cAMP-binding protein